MDKNFFERVHTIISLKTKDDSFSKVSFIKGSMNVEYEPGRTYVAWKSLSLGKTPQEYDFHVFYMNVLKKILVIVFKRVYLKDGLCMLKKEINLEFIEGTTKDKKSK